MPVLIKFHYFKRITAIVILLLLVESQAHAMLGLGNLKGLAWVGFAVVSAYLILLNVVAFLFLFWMERFAKVDQPLTAQSSFRFYCIAFSVPVLLIPAYGRFDLLELFRVLIFLVIHLCIAKLLWVRFQMTHMHLLKRIVLFSFLLSVLVSLVFLPNLF